MADDILSSIDEVIAANEQRFHPFGPGADGPHQIPLSQSAHVVGDESRCMDCGLVIVPTTIDTPCRPKPRRVT